jgi:hypothetical protein
MPVRALVAALAVAAVQTKKPRLRAVFVRKQKAQQKALLKALLRCK